MKIGIYGGSFDPPHIGHINAAHEAIRRINLDKLYVIPVGMPPHKDFTKSSASGAERIDMLKTAFLGDEKIEILDIEVVRPGRSYTVDTLASIRKKHPFDELFLLMGTDMFTSFETWREFEKILSDVTIAVFKRAAGEEHKIEQCEKKLEEKYNAKIVTVEIAAIEAASSDIREKLPLRMGREFLNDKVYGYIIRNHLYGAKADFEWLREKAYAMLDPKRIAHVSGCEQEAVRLAKRWGADVDEARTAGILHDITKKWRLDEQLKTCREYGIILDNMEQKESKLLHSKTGAEIAKREFGVSDSVYDAILWHTTGRAGMALLEKIIYIADYIEPNRDFTDLTQLRRLAYENIDEAMLLGLNMSIEDMKLRGITPHYRSIEAIKWFDSLVR